MAIRTTPVDIKTILFQRNEMDIQYPQVYNLNSQEVEQNINNTIIQSVEQLIQQQMIQQQSTQFSEMIGSYEIKTNERHILSLTLSNYAYVAQHANGLTMKKSLTFNTKTGELYQLADLFKDNSNYIKRLSQMVRKQIKERDIPLLHPFTQISPNQDFYIADKSLVIYFEPFEITPHYVGFPMFPISVYSIEDIIKPGSPLDILKSQ